MLLDSLTTPPLPTAFKYLLDDGTPALFRLVRPEDGSRLKSGFYALSQISRRRQLLTESDEISDEQIDRLASVDQDQRVAWGAINMNRPAEPGIGLARYVVLRDDALSADVAIVVLDPYQGQGAGQVLHACLHLSAHMLGLKRFYYDVHADNLRFIRLLKALGARHEGRADNVDRLSLPVYHRAWDVPAQNPLGMRFADVFRRLHKAEPMPVERFAPPPDEA